MQSHLVGRDDELVQLDQALEDALAGRGSLWLLSGEPGIGKTTLARVFSERAAAAGGKVVWGRAWEAGGAPPYWPWVEVLRGLSSLLPPGFIDGLGTTARALLSRLVPELAAAPDLLVLDAASARFLTSEAVLAYLTAAAGVRPLALVLDDLHAADRASVELLHFIAARLRDLRIVVCGTLRDAEARIAPDAATALTQLSREARHLPLMRLALADVAKLVAHAWQAAGAAVLAELSAHISVSSEGNPLFAVEMLRLARARAGVSATVPDGVRGVVHQRLRLLRPDTRRLLELAAIQGRAFDLGWLCLAFGDGEGVVRDLLDDAVRADIIVERDHDHLAFTHVLIRDALYRELDPGARAALHLASAEALERRIKVDAREHAVGLAHHFLEAAAGGAPRAHEKALRYARAAAERAVELQAHEDAVALLERALALVELDRSQPADERDRQRAEMMLALGLAHMRVAHYARGKAYCQEVAAIARRSVGQPWHADLLSRSALAFGLYIGFGLIDHDLAALLTEALPIAPTDALRARLMARLAAARQPAEEPARPMALAREAIALARQLDDPATRLEVLTSGGSALLYFGEPAERVSLNRELLQVAIALGDKVRQLRAQLRLVFDHLELADAASADACIAAHRQLAGELRLPAFTWQVPLLRVTRALVADGCDEAEVALTEARELPGRPDDIPAHHTLVSLRVGIGRASGRPDRQSEAELLAYLTVGFDSWYMRAARFGFAAMRREDEAPELPPDIASELRATAPEFAKWHLRLSVAWLGEACALLGDPEIAAQIYPHVLPFAHRNHVWGVGPMVCEGPIAETLGRLAVILGRLDEARGHFEAALGRAERMGAPGHVARIRGRLASLESPAASRSGLSRPARGGSFSLVREGELWTLAYADRITHLKDSRGLRILDKLVRQPGRDIHVFELLDQSEADGGDAGDALDGAALRAYRERARELRAELDEAEGWSDSARAERLRAELMAIGDEVARGAGLGGRSRKDGSQAERARVNVRRRIVDTLERITADLPELARHLERSLKTGVVCAYRPSPDDAIVFASP